MNEERSFHQAMLDNPNDLTLRMVFADWLEERGDPRGELLRLTHTLTQSIDVPRRAELEARMQALVDEGVQAVGPYWTNSIGMRFAWIPAGTFLMGRTKIEEDDDRTQFGDQYDQYRITNAVQHQVTLTKGFFLGIHPVTQAQWQAVMGQNPSHYTGENRPVERISWLHAIAFCNTLSQKESKKPYHVENDQTTGNQIDFHERNGYRLATEAQWEYACRGGSTTRYCFGNDADKLGEYAWSLENSGNCAHSVGQKKPNAWGLYDMHGSICEWCEDWDDEAYYQNSPCKDPVNVIRGLLRVLRGGSWTWPAEDCTASYRYGFNPDVAYWKVGFRLLAVSSSPIR